MTGDHDWRIPVSLRNRAYAEAEAARVQANTLVGPDVGPPPSRRLRVYMFTPDALLSLGQHPGRLVTANPTIPADVRPCGVAYDFARDVFLVRVESAEFAEVPEGMPIPFGDGSWLRMEEGGDGP
jgi:hypothetical protein